VIDALVSDAPPNRAPVGPLAQRELDRDSAVIVERSARSIIAAEYA
jgi:hypothetical protein